MVTTLILCCGKLQFAVVLASDFIKIMNVKILIVVVFVVVVIAGIGFWYWSQKRAGVSEAPVAAEVVKDGLGAEALKKTQNPLSNELPETNPFRAKINPFK